MERVVKIGSVVLAVVLCLPATAGAMHIMEGFLPPAWAIGWGAISIPFVIFGFYSIKRKVSESSKRLLILAMCGAFTFILSALKLPSVTGSCSHPTGVGLGAILFGPTAMAVIGTIVLLFQALLLAHGGLTTLGANVFSMAIIGPFAAFGTYMLLKRLQVNRSVCAFFAAFLGDLLTYVATSVQLSLAFPDPVGGIAASLAKFMAIFAVTQIPIAISEGLLTVVVYNLLEKYSADEVHVLERVGA